MAGNSASASGRQAMVAPLSLVRGPAWLTLAVTLLRLAGEKLDGAPELFSRAAGGGLAIVGISWLIPLVGAFLGWKLQRRGAALPELRRAVGLPFVALALPWSVAWAAGKAFGATWTSNLAVWAVASLSAALLAALAWPALGRLLFAYAVLARLPVALLTAAAMGLRWGTHYDAPPPGFPAMPVLQRWLWLGLLPQATIWVGVTLGVGALCGVAGWIAASSASSEE